MALVLLSSCAKPLEVEELGYPGRPVADAIVVLGNRPPVDKTGGLQPELAHRLRHGIELYKRGYAPLLVMSGGPSEVGVEAEHMKRFAVEAGVLEKNILSEGESTTTIENASFTRRLLCQDGKCLNHIILVSNPYHARRGAKLFECAGFKVSPFPTAFSERQDENRLHENMVNFFYAFIDECARARVK